ncbi:MAG: RloB family protein [Acidimicrobiaceae bacterium]|nr:RloB family protein [Acidimicrobiaceae bacterium]
MNRPRRKVRRRVVPQGGKTSERVRVIRVHTEGRVTERDYLNHWARLNSGVRIDWGESGVDPMSLVSRAQAELRRSSVNTRRHGVADFDEIWCVFDVDEHPNRSQAIFEARQSDVNVAVSNPCFELWLVLHVEDRAGPVHRSDIQRDATKLNLIRGKSVPDVAWESLEDGYEAAKRRARSLDQMHRDNESPSRSNPSTDVWRLVDRIRS